MLWQLLAADHVARLGGVGEGVELEVLLAAVVVAVAVEGVGVGVAAEDVGVGGVVVDQIKCVRAQHSSMYLYATVFCLRADCIQLGKCLFDKVRLVLLKYLH